MRNKRVTRRALVAACVLASVSWAVPQTPADLIVFNARIYTGVPSQPWAEALAIRGHTYESTTLPRFELKQDIPVPKYAKQRDCS